MPRLGRWFLTLSGGLLLGAGLVLHGQVALARWMRAEVEDTFFLWRAVGEATIFVQGGDVRFALALREVPEDVLRESDVAAWTLVAVGLLLAVAAPLHQAADHTPRARPRIPGRPRRRPVSG